MISSYKENTFSYGPFLAPFLIYGGTFFYGYLNYVFSVSMFLITLGLWLRWRKKLTHLRIACLCIITFGVYLSHLSSIAFLAMAITIINVYDLVELDPSEKRSKTDLMKDMVIFIAPAVAFLSFIEGSGSGTVGTLAWNSLSGKIVGLASPFRSYDLWADIITVLSVLITFILLKIKRTLEFDPRLLLVASLFLLTYIFAPERFFTNDADMRIVLPAFVLLILALRPIVRSKAILGIILVPLLLLTVRQGAIVYRWVEMGNQFNSEKRLLSEVRGKIRSTRFSEGVSLNI